MIHLKFLVPFTFATILFNFACTPSQQAAKVTDIAKESDLAKNKGYWTCPMHPQIHNHEEGRCPICGMPLVHVEDQKESKDLAFGVQTSEIQIQNANLSKYKVVKKDLVVSLAVAGRMTTANEVSLQIYESDLGFIKIGLKITGSTSSHPTLNVGGKIKQIDSLVDPSSRTVRVTAQLDSKVSGFVAETSFHGQLQSTIKNQIAIPEDAVLRAGKRDLVYRIANDGKLTPTEVVLGQKGIAEYQILSGLSEGDEISAGANFLIDSESKIRGQ